MNRNQLGGSWTLAGLALLGLSALSVQAQTFTYTTGDLLAAFHRTGSPDLLVNLGAVGTFKSLTPGTTLDLTSRYSVNDQLLASFGTVDSLSFGIVGAQANKAPLNYQANTAWLSLARTDPAVQTTAPSRYKASTAATIQSDVGGIAGDGSTKGALIYAPNATYGTGAGLSSATALIIPTTGLYAPNAYSSQYASGLAAHASPAPDNTTAANFSTTPGAVAVSDLYEYVPLALGKTGNATYLGSFTLANNGVLTFTPVPEPGTWAFLALGSLVLVAVQRNRKSASSTVA